MLDDGRTELLVSGEAIWFGVELALLMARMGVFPGVARWACGSRGSPDAWASFFIHPCIGRHDFDTRCDLLYQGRATFTSLVKN
jgi:hypothetical protein